MGTLFKELREIGAKKLWHKDRVGEIFFCVPFEFWTMVNDLLGKLNKNKSKNIKK